MTDEKSNIINFPREHIRPHLIKDIDVNETRQTLLRENCNTITQITTDFVIDNFRAVGVDLNLGENQLCVKDFVLLIESMKSLLYKYYGLEHPMQLVAENAFTVDGNFVKYKNSEVTVSEIGTDEYQDNGF